MTTGLTFIIGAKDMASKVLKGISSAMRDTFVVGAGNLLAGGIVKMMDGLRGMVDGILEAEQANTRLDAALRGLGMYTPQLSNQMRTLAGEIQDLTGASDESVKAQIAQLLTLGVMPSKMSGALKAVAALTAISKDGAMSLNAVGRMLNGDIAAFEKFSPAVRNATTTQEKFAAIQELLNAGFEQQQADLGTVAGAWAALKGRIGDAVEDMGMAAMEGLGLGKSLKDAQASLGDFLKGDSWTSFIEGIRAGGESVKQIIDALGSQGGVKNTLNAVGDIIVAAFKDGATFAADKIKSAFGDTGIGKVLGGVSDVIGGVWDAAGWLDQKIGTAEEAYTGQKLGYSSRGVAERERAAQGNTLTGVLDRIKATAEAEKALQSEAESLTDILKSQGTALDNLFGDDVTILEDSVKSIVNSSKKIGISLETAANRTERLKTLSSKISSAWEAQYSADKQSREQARQSRLEQAKNRADMLMQEFMDPSKRTDRLAQERASSETESKLQAEYAAIQRKQGSMFGMRDPSERERQVMELMAARDELNGAEDAIQKEIAANTRGLAEKLDSLLKLT